MSARIFYIFVAITLCSLFCLDGFNNPERWSVTAKHCITTGILYLLLPDFDSVISRTDPR